MTLQVEFWELLTLLATVLLAILGGFMAIIRSMLQQTREHLDLRFEKMEEASLANGQQLAKRLDLIEQAGREDTAQWTRIERELLNLKADLPISYVRREDYVASIATIMAKLDAISLRFENILLKGGGQQP